MKCCFRGYAALRDGPWKDVTFSLTGRACCLGAGTELSERTMRRLGYIRSNTAHAIGGMAKLALRYSTNLRILRRTQALLSDDYGPAGAAGAWAMPPHPPGPQDRLRDYGPEEAADAVAELPAP